MLESEVAQLTDHQVLYLVQLKGLPSREKLKLQELIKKRGLIISNLPNPSNKPLHLSIKIILVALPFLWQIIILMEFISKGRWLIFQTQWKQFWFYLSMGLLLWLVLFLLMAKFIIPF